MCHQKNNKMSTLRRLYEKYSLFTHVGWFFLLSGVFYVIYFYHLSNPAFLPNFDWDFYIKDTYITFGIVGIVLPLGFYFLKGVAYFIFPQLWDLKNKDKIRS